MSVNEYNHALGELLMLSGHLNYRNFSVEEAKAFNKLFDVIEDYERKNGIPSRYNQDVQK
ncbi:hypothetical protein GNP82_02250 [Aliivibrio fischeri]|uniref:hypothetical protein n=1 Tax=Aliivibrio fischeri TaxID=668 RepID=UPI0012D8A16A|nr:hypothetical protein [Aliivibrio fischeri]MUK36403.1 hypothetical protein [Aliivibrio fischeri]MUL03304.1 hypothetical protein [Aliivibrio fischeri]MUL05696.1 hypothetical protein [Aliivibrio fischeri]